MFESGEVKEKKPVDYTGLILAAILAPVLILFIHFGKGEVGRAVCIDLGSILFAMKIRWDLRNRIWYWAVVVLLLALHVPLFLFIHWPGGWVPAIAALPFAVVDCLIVLGSLRFVEKYIVKTPPPEEG
jgi:hypothetical protein